MRDQIAGSVVILGILAAIGAYMSGQGLPLFLLIAFVAAIFIGGPILKSKFDDSIENSHTSKLRGTVGQEPMKSSATASESELYFRLATQISNEEIKPNSWWTAATALEKEQGKTKNPFKVISGLMEINEMTKTRQITVVTATFDFSPKAISEIKKKNLERFTIAHSDPMTLAEHDAIQNSSGTTGQVPLLVGDVIKAPTQRLLFDRYDTAVEAIPKIQDNMKRLKEYCTHGAAKPIVDTFEA